MNVQNLPQSLTAQEVMSRVLVTVTGEESPLMAWELMRRAQVHHLPVIDARCRPLGILTRQDVAEAWSGGPAEQSDRQIHSLLGRRRMSRVRPGQPLAEVAAAMLDACCDAVPVVEQEGRLIGLITAVDVLTALAGRTPAAQEPGEVRSALFRIEPVTLSAQDT